MWGKAIMFLFLFVPIVSYALNVETISFNIETLYKKYEEAIIIAIALNLVTGIIVNWASESRYVKIAFRIFATLFFILVTFYAFGSSFLSWLQKDENAYILEFVSKTIATSSSGVLLPFILVIIKNRKKIFPASHNTLASIINLLKVYKIQSPIIKVNLIELEKEALEREKIRRREEEERQEQKKKEKAEKKVKDKKETMQKEAEKEKQKQREQEEAVFLKLGGLAESGDAEAQCNLALKYHHKDELNIAFKWFQKSAEQGYAEAEYSIGYMYYEGQATPSNYSKAAEWYLKAAQQGHAIAQLNVGSMYLAGQVTGRRDIRQGYIWISMSRTNGATEAQEELDRLIAVELLTPQEVSNLQDMATQCWESNYKKCGSDIL